LRLAGRGATWERCASERLHLYPGKQMLGVLCYVAQVASSNTWVFLINLKKLQKVAVRG